MLLSPVLALGLGWLAWELWADVGLAFAVGGGALVAGLILGKFVAHSAGRSSP